MPSPAMLCLLFVIRSCVGCIPTISPDDDDIMAQLEEMRTTMTMMETTETCGAACQPSSTLGTTLPTTSSTTTTTTTSTTTTTTSTCSVATCMCLGSDLLFENSCYRIINPDLFTFPDSKTECGMLNGGNLCIITSMAENDHIYDIVTATACGGSCNVHIGGDRVSASDPYIWPDNIPFSSTWTNWAAGEPDTAANKLCVQWLISKEWQANRCDELSYPCCEYPAIPIV